jgi:hypothetical protein
MECRCPARSRSAKHVRFSDSLVAAKIGRIGFGHGERHLHTFYILPLTLLQAFIPLPIRFDQQNSLQGSTKMDVFYIGGIAGP